MAKKALVVDDVEFNRMTVKTYLLMAGFTVDMAENGIAGLKKLAEGKYDLIFSDIEMPNMNGLEFLKKVKLTLDYKSIPFVILSSLGDDAILKKTKDLGASCHITKPYNREKIQMALKLVGF